MSVKNHPTIQTQVNLVEFTNEFESILQQRILELERIISSAPTSRMKDRCEALLHLNTYLYKSFLVGVH